MSNRTRVEIINIYYDEIETDSCVCGENVRLKLKNVEEEVAILKHESIICPEYSAVLHIHAAVVIITLIDRKTGEQPRFIKPDQVAIIRIELSQVGQVICMEPFRGSPRLSRFTLRDGNRTITVGRVLKIVE